MKYIEKDFPIEKLNEIARKEGNAKKPIYQIHKWWARRLGSVFRMILLTSFTEWEELEKEARTRLGIGSSTDLDEEVNALLREKMEDIMKTLGIIGGMGTLATLDFFRKVVSNTEAKCDSDHLHIVIENDSEIPDRTSFIQGMGIDPTLHLVNAAKRLESIGADFLVMPCNTAHYFYNKIVKEINIPLSAQRIRWDFLNGKFNKRHASLYLAGS